MSTTTTTTAAGNEPVHGEQMDGLGELAQLSSALAASVGVRYSAPFHSGRFADSTGGGDLYHSGAGRLASSLAV